MANQHGDPVTHPPEEVNYDVPGRVVIRTTETDLQIKLKEMEHKLDEQSKDNVERRRQRNREHWFSIIQDSTRLFLAVVILVLVPYIAIKVSNDPSMSADAKQWLFAFLGGVGGIVLTYLFGGKGKNLLGKKEDGE